VTQPSELTGLLQQLIQQQREDKLAAEEARKAAEARFAQLQQEAARDRAATDERFVGLLDRVTQRQDAQIQQMQQGMFALFGMVQQLLTHTGLVPQQQTGHERSSPCSISDSSFSSSFGTRHCIVSSWDLPLSYLLASATGVALPVTWSAYTHRVYHSTTFSSE
jgi:hypothetical protein